MGGGLDKEEEAAGHRCHVGVLRSLLAAADPQCGTLLEPTDGTHDVKGIVLDAKASVGSFGGASYALDEKEKVADGRVLRMCT